MPRRTRASLASDMDAPVDIIMLAHNRLEHLVATVDALEAHTHTPYRLTVVDNASGPEVRNWLAANRGRFERIIWSTENEMLGAFNRGMAHATSDPFIVTDPDLVVPDLEPCWLTQMLGMMERHPDFGLIGIGLDQSNLPPVQEPEHLSGDEIVDGEIVERFVGSTFQLIRRDALREPYRTDHKTCLAVRAACYRVGWALDVRALHLGWDDFKIYPGHLASKLHLGEYREVNLIERAPSLPELALAGPVVAQTRAHAIPDAAVVEITWGDPAVAAALPDAVCLQAPPPGPLPFADDAAGAVVLVDPPPERAAELVLEARRVATGLVVAIAGLDAFGARPADELAGDGWTGHEAPGPGDVPLALAHAAAMDPALSVQLGVTTIDDRERWLDLFAAGAFGRGSRRLWVWSGPETPPPAAVAYDPFAVDVWARVATPPARPRRSLARRVKDRADVRRRLARLRLSPRTG
jgi:hypothetical protein